MKPTIEADALIGGREFNVQFRDGRTETVAIRALGVRDYDAYLKLLDDECAAAELLCSKPRGWADKVHPTSLGELVTVGLEVQQPFFSDWLGRRVDRQRQLVGNAAAQIEAAARQKSAAASLASSPTSASEPAEAAQS